MSKQLEHGWNLNPTLLKYHAENNQHAMKMHKKDQIILKVMLYFNSFWILWTKTWHQTDEKKGVMEKPSISIPSSHRFVHLTKTILNTATNANEVFYEFNRTLAMEGLGSISVGTFNWLKKYRPYVGIFPPMSDYCDKCKEHEEISRMLNQLRCGHRAWPMFGLKSGAAMAAPAAPMPPPLWI